MLDPRFLIVFSKNREDILFKEHAEVSTAFLIKRNQPLVR